jgi:hypothetical protein
MKKGDRVWRMVFKRRAEGTIIAVGRQEGLEHLVRVKWDTWTPPYKDGEGNDEISNPTSQWEDKERLELV